MRKATIEKIIKQGSTRQKIRLYFTDVAYFNTVDVTIPKDGRVKDNTSLINKHQLLTERERNIIFNSVKERKDIKYWEELRTWNKAFLMFKPNITARSRFITYLTAQLSKQVTVRLLHSSYEDAINDMLDAVKDKALREDLIKIATDSLEIFDARRYQEKGYPPFVEIVQAKVVGEVWVLVELINEELKETKEFIKGMEIFLDKYLPLKPYKQFVKDGEKRIKEDIKECRDLIQKFILLPLFNPNSDSDIIEIGKELRIDEIDKYEIHKWEDVVVDVTEDDIEDIKSAGL